MIENEQFKEFQRRVPEIDLTMGGSEGSLDLWRDADLLNDPARAEKFEKLAKSSKWVGNAVEFTYLMNRSLSSDKPKTPVILGLSNTYPNIPKAIQLISNGTDFINAHIEYNVGVGYYKNRTQDLLDAVTEDERDVIFVVPSNLYNYPDPDAIATKEEMDYYLDNPERASSTHFVFGAYEFIDEGWFAQEKQSRLIGNTEISKHMTEWLSSILKT